METKPVRSWSNEQLEEYLVVDGVPEDFYINKEKSTEDNIVINRQKAIKLVEALTARAARTLKTVMSGEYGQNGPVTPEEDGELWQEVTFGDMGDGGNVIMAALNGRSYIIPVNTKVWIPNWLLKCCIDDAVEGVPEELVNPKTGSMEYVYRKTRKRISYTIHGQKWKSKNK